MPTRQPDHQQTVPAFHQPKQLHPAFDDYYQSSSYQQPHQFYNNNTIYMENKIRLNIIVIGQQQNRRSNNNRIYRQGGNLQNQHTRNANLQQQFQPSASASQFGKIPVQRSYSPTNRSLFILFKLN